MKNEKMISVKPLVLERALRDAGLIRFETDSHVVELRALLDTPAPCAHEWTDDGGHLIVCTACGAQEDHDPGWRDMENAPKDGTMLRLLVSFDEHSTEDADEAPTIGANNFDNDGEDAWRFAGWCWTHDHFTQGVGTPVGWLPMIEASASTAKLDRITAERDALQLLLNERDEQVHSLEQRRQAEQPAPVAAAQTCCGSCPGGCVIDAGNRDGVAGVLPPEQCRQRIAAEGKPYPRSSCAVCGQFSPKSRECDALIEASRLTQIKQ